MPPFALDSLYPGCRIFELFQRFLKNGARRTHVKSHETFATAAEHLAVVERKMCLVHEERHE